MQYLYVSVGGLCVVIGVIGIFLPLLPTTPFLLLAAFCFNRGSKKFHNWLLNHKVFGPPIADWNRDHVIRLRYKILASVVMASTTIVFLLKISVPLAGKISYCILMIAVSAFIWTRKSQ